MKNRTVIAFVLTLVLTGIYVPVSAQEHEIQIKCALAPNFSPGFMNITTADKASCIYVGTASIAGQQSGRFIFKNDAEDILLVRRIKWQGGKLIFTLTDGRVFAGAWGSGLSGFGQRWSENLAVGSRTEVHRFWIKSHTDKTGSQILNVYVPEQYVASFWNCTEMVSQQRSCTIE